ncbi:uncharacterized protein PgNI_08008 [Pyricularia grisea]|uniref:AMP-dependent synthetase/ligase domain-containing protein n=1 Tax=Pyricularia grisea TaxID=148305 RepID=A0A6P8AX20_PYRGI|nr:uncharacterized protein PgNI_08008 [Pyricularia grisea]TLD06709.1 hypothetical protein PgNI_08008 [Pyricularia grisea]
MSGVGFHTHTLVVECRMAKDDDDDTVLVSLAFDANLLSEQLVQAIGVQFEHVLGQIMQAVSPSGLRRRTKLADLRLVSEEERTRLLAWNSPGDGSNFPVAVMECAHEVIERRAEENPDDAAVVSTEGGVEFTFQQLDRAAGRLAVHLRSLGVGADSFVPCCFEKSPLYVVAQLAVMKAGGAFVPVEPSHPEARRLDIIRQLGGDSGAVKVLLVTPTTVQVFSESSLKDVASAVIEVLIA